MFVVAYHDAWVRKREQLNEASILLTDPETLEVFRVRIALTESLGKKSVDLCETHMLGLERAGKSERH